MLYETIAKDVFLALYKQFTTTSSVRIWRTTILCLFELIDRYGFAFFELETEKNFSKRGRTLFNNDTSQDEEEEQPQNAVSLMNFMSHLMDNCDENSIKVRLN